MKELNIIHFCRWCLQIRSGLVAPLTEVDFWRLWSDAPSSSPRPPSLPRLGLSAKKAKATGWACWVTYAPPKECVCGIRIRRIASD